VLDAGAGGEEGAIELDGQHFLPLLQAEFLHRLDDLDAGIAHQDINAAIGLHRGFDRGVHLVFLRHIDRQPQGGTALACNILGRRLGSFLLQIGDHHLGALLRIQIGDGLANATGGARHIGHLACELLNHFFFLSTGKAVTNPKSRAALPHASVGEQAVCMTSAKPLARPLPSGPAMERSGGKPYTCGFARLFEQDHEHHQRLRRHHPIQGDRCARQAAGQRQPRLPAWRL